MSKILAGLFSPLGVHRYQFCLCFSWTGSQGVQFSGHRIYKNDLGPPAAFEKFTQEYQAAVKKVSVLKSEVRVLCQKNVSLSTTESLFFKRISKNLRVGVISESTIDSESERQADEEAAKMWEMYQELRV